jgi:hypothetical protein
LSPARLEVDADRPHKGRSSHHRCQLSQCHDVFLAASDEPHRHGRTIHISRPPSDRSSRCMGRASPHVVKWRPSRLPPWTDRRRFVAARPLPTGPLVADEAQARLGEPRVHLALIAPLAAACLFLGKLMLSGVGRRLGLCETQKRP